MDDYRSEGFLQNEANTSKTLTSEMLRAKVFQSCGLRKVLWRTLFIFLSLLVCILFSILNKMITLYIYIYIYI